MANPVFHNDGTMTLGRISPFSGEFNKRTMKVTQDQWETYKLGSTAVQHAFPDLTADEREFILTGITAREWDETFSEKED